MGEPCGLQCLRKHGVVGGEQIPRHTTSPGTGEVASLSEPERAPRRECVPVCLAPSSAAHSTGQAIPHRIQSPEIPS